MTSRNENQVARMGIEDDVLGLSARGVSIPKIVEQLRAKGHEGLSRQAVRRFLAAEKNAREAQRRALGASAAAKITAQAGDLSQQYVQQLSEVAGAMYTMATKGYRVVHMPGAQPVNERIGPTNQIKAAEAMKSVAGYVIELAGAAGPMASDTDKKRIYAVLSEAFGYVPSAKGDDSDEEGDEGDGATMDAPLTAEEHQEPSVH